MSLKTMPILLGNLRSDMGIKEINEAAIESEHALYHEFLQQYRKKSTIYGFYEGKDDVSFYTSYIQNITNNKVIYNYKFIGNKKRLVAFYNEFDWRRFDRHQICFFMDRDLSDVLNVPEQ